MCGVCVCEVGSESRQGGRVSAPVRTICLSSWVDNIFSFSDSVHKATGMLDIFEGHITRVWGLSIKDSSRECIVCKGNTEKPLDSVRWPVTNVMKVLGHMIQYDGGLRHEWQATRSAMWAAYWANCSNKTCFKLGSVAKLGLLNKCVVSRISWKLPRWPMQKTVAVNLDSLQARMISALIPCARHAHEDIDTYDRRRKRLARNHCAKEGVWSKVWAKRMISWHEHIMRTCRAPRSFSPL